MGRRKRVPYNEWAARPHADGRPQGLWWWHDLPREDRLRVVVVYFERKTYLTKHEPKGSVLDRYRHVCVDFKLRCPTDRGTPEEIETISDLATTPDSTSRSPKQRGCFVTLEGAAIQRQLKSKKVFHWFSRLDEIARELYREKFRSSIDANFVVTRAIDTVAEEKKGEIRAEYLDKGNARELAERHCLPASRIGQIVKAQKKLRRERLEKLAKLVEVPTGPLYSDEQMKLDGAEAPDDYIPY